MGQRASTIKSALIVIYVSFGVTTPRVVKLRKFAWHAGQMVP
jgi:hypothetical protein